MKKRKKIVVFCIFLIVIIIGLIICYCVKNMTTSKRDNTNENVYNVDENKIEKESNVNLDNIDKTELKIEKNIDKINNNKIEWGIKRGDNNNQPDVGSKNKKLMDEYGEIYLGNNNKPYVYLTFDLGYEAGYTEKILEVLKQNEVKATFFITGHYLNTQSDLVQKMINEGQIVRKSHCQS